MGHAPHGAPDPSTHGGASRARKRGLGQGSRGFVALVDGRPKEPSPSPPPIAQTRCTKDLRPKVDDRLVPRKISLSRSSALAEQTEIIFRTPDQNRYRL